MLTISDRLAEVHLGTALTYQNLTLFPLLHGGGGAPDYLTLDEALANGSARVKEIDAGARVPELVFVNGGDLPVFLLDGEELIGAKQNRVLNLSILVPASQEVVIPVSCVEQGRWAFSTREFSTSPRVHFAEGRAARMWSVGEDLRTSGGRSSNQSDVWARVADRVSCLRVASPTDSMSDVYEQEGDRLQDFVDRMTPVEGQSGAAFAVGDRVIGLDLFDYPQTLEKLLPKLVRSYALDSLVEAGPRHPKTGFPGGERTRNQKAGKAIAPDPAAVEALLESVASAEEQSFPAVGEGEDIRLTGEDLTGAALFARGRTIHLSAFVGKAARGE